MTQQLEQIRNQFPSLKRNHHGYPVAYFDGPGGTQIPRRVAESMVDYLYYHNANTHWAFPTSKETDLALIAARSTLAEFLNAPVDTIVIGSNMTTLTFRAARALGRGFSVNDEIVVTDLDHHANIDPWRDLASELGLIIRTVPFDIATGQLNMKAFEQSLSARTRLVAIGAASNALGTASDLNTALSLARAVGALTFVDGVHSAPHFLPDVTKLGCDFFACSPYKFYGPHAGILYARREILDALSVSRLAPSSNRSPYRMETGTLNHEAIVGSAAAVDFLASIGRGSTRRKKLVSTYAALHKQGNAQIRRIWEALKDFSHVTVYGPGPEKPRTPTLSFTVREMTSRSVSESLAAKGLFLSHGDFYATTVVKRLGVEGLVRVGCACFTSDEEIERLIRAIGELG